MWSFLYACKHSAAAEFNSAFASSSCANLVALPIFMTAIVERIPRIPTTVTNSRMLKPLWFLLDSCCNRWRLRSWRALVEVNFFFDLLLVKVQLINGALSSCNKRALSVCKITFIFYHFVAHWLVKRVNRYFRYKVSLWLWWLCIDLNKKWIGVIYLAPIHLL